MAESIKELRKRRMEEIQKLPPAQRIAALKKLEEELHEREEELKAEEEEAKKEIEAARELAAQSEDEIQTLEKILPKQKEVKVEELFEKTDLEEKVAGPQKPLSEAEQRQYAQNLALQPMQELYSRFQEVKEKIENARTYQTDAKTNEEFIRLYETELGTIHRAMHYKNDAIQSGQYKSASQEVRSQMSAIENIMSHYKN